MKYLNDADVKAWQKISTKLRDLTAEASKIRLDFLSTILDRGGDPAELEKALHLLDGICDACDGSSYLFHPQAEWTGGNSNDPKNFKVRTPHIYGRK